MVTPRIGKTLWGFHQEGKNREESLETSQWKLEVPPAGEGDAGGGIGGTGNIPFQKA